MIRSSILICMTVLLMALATTAGFADIPQGVDYQAKWDDTGWTVLHDKYTFGAPNWGGANTGIDVPNLHYQPWIKWFWVEVDYVNLPAVLPNLQVFATDSTVYPLGVTVNVRNVTWLWKIIPQPASEQVIFPDVSFHDLVDISSVEVASLCGPVPEPGSLVALGSGLIALAGTILKKRR
jgi:hypothetical protein